MDAFVSKSMLGGKAIRAVELTAKQRAKLKGEVQASRAFLRGDGGAPRPESPAPRSYAPRRESTRVGVRDEAPRAVMWHATSRKNARKIMQGGFKGNTINHSNTEGSYATNTFQRAVMYAGREKKAKPAIIRIKAGKPIHEGYSEGDWLYRTKELKPDRIDGPGRKWRRKRERVSYDPKVSRLQEEAKRVAQRRSIPIDRYYSPRLGGSEGVAEPINPMAARRSILRGEDVRQPVVEDRLKFAFVRKEPVGKDLAGTVRWTTKTGKTLALKAKEAQVKAQVAAINAGEKAKTLPPKKNTKARRVLRRVGGTALQAAAYRPDALAMMASRAPQTAIQFAA